MINEEGGVDPEQFRMEAMFDRMDCIGKGILGLTIQCAQCHSHKYDPLTQDEYYGMFAFLNNAHEANVAVYTREEQAKKEKIGREIRDVEELIRRHNPDWPARMAAWEKQVVGRSARVGDRAAGGRGRIDGRRQVSTHGGRLVPGPGVCADQAHGRDVGEDRRRADHGVSAGAADRPEPAAGWPGAVDQGDGGAHGVSRRGGAGGWEGASRSR